MIYNTFFIANNKTRICAIWETEKSREEAVSELNFGEYDIVMTCDNTAHAQELIQKGNYQLTQVDDFM